MKPLPFLSFILIPFHFISVAQAQSFQVELTVSREVVFEKVEDGSLALKLDHLNCGMYAETEVSTLPKGNAHTHLYQDTSQLYRFGKRLYSKEELQSQVENSVRQYLRNQEGYQTLSKQISEQTQKLKESPFHGVTDKRHADKIAELDENKALFKEKENQGIREMGPGILRQILSKAESTLFQNVWTLFIPREISPEIRTLLCSSTGDQGISPLSTQEMIQTLARAGIQLRILSEGETDVETSTQ